MSAVSSDPDSGAPLQLSVSGLSVRFGPLTAIDAVDLDVRAGELLAVAGENGAGKTTLVRCIAGDLAPTSGAIHLDGRPLAPGPLGAKRRGISVVWQDLALCDNLDIASNVLLGRERWRHLVSATRMHTDAARLFDRLGIDLGDTTRSVRSLSGGQRQLVAVARAMAHNPRLLLLDEPTAWLGVQESALIEKLITRLRERGTTIVLACHDVSQMFRLADRIAILRHGRLVAEVAPSEVHPDDVVALLSGQEVDSSARRQLTRLHGLTGRLVSADPSSSLSLILSALGAALGTERLCIHLVDDSSLAMAASLGLPPPLLSAWSRLPRGLAGGPVGMAAESEHAIIEENVRASSSWAPFAGLARSARVASSWSVPVLGPGGLLGVITVFRSISGKPQRDDLDLATLYAGYAASAIERDRLLDEVTARNRVLETIREMLETLAGPTPVAHGLGIALQSLRRGLEAQEVALVHEQPDGLPLCRACSGPTGAPSEAIATQAALGAAESALAVAHHDGRAMHGAGTDGERLLWVVFTAPGGRAALVARWPGGRPGPDATALMEDAAHSLRLALEREAALLAHQEAVALRRSQDLQRGFLSRLNHELRTPLTAIRGYASSLLQPDVSWDSESKHRFLVRIAAESSRLGRLVDDLLDFSAIESGIFRLQRDWCELQLVLDAALACLPPDSLPGVELDCASDLPAVWGDHDRLEQVFVNLLANAIGHNPPGTKVMVRATTDGPDRVRVSVADDGRGMPPDVVLAPFEPMRRRRTPTAGAGLGLSIARGIVAAHGGLIELEPRDRGTCLLIHLPVEAPEGPASGNGTGIGTAATTAAEPMPTTGAIRGA
ncbi:MAG TPA: ATP-binding cassette domain-containing protein [Streptosporangiaceae bacterium]|jgi:signal transduction histidine kinase/ABC-type multidrug transport system ATPase subunit|nr:ATP-binding cassette domain-containing protein [Streptosporangiaceae bacterium]